MVPARRAPVQSRQDPSAALRQRASERLRLVSSSRGRDRCHALKEHGDQRCDVGRVFLQGKVPCLEQMQLGGRHILQVRLSPGLQKDGIVTAPEDEQRWLLTAQPCLPRRIQRQIRVVVEREVDLNLLATGPVEEVLVKRPAVRRNTLLAAGGVQVLALRRLERQEFVYLRCRAVDAVA
jgi:hypothetical protein